MARWLGWQLRLKSERQSADGPQVDRQIDVKLTATPLTPDYRTARRPKAVRRRLASLAVLGRHRARHHIFRLQIHLHYHHQRRCD